MFRYNEVSRAVDRLAWYYSSFEIASKVTLGELPPQRTIGVFVTSSIDEILLELALGRMGLTVLFLSVNNSAAAVAHLIKSVNATHLIYSPKFIEATKDAQVLLKGQGVDIKIIEDMRFPLWGQEGVSNNMIQVFPPALTPAQEVNRIAIYVHSSGSVRISSSNKRLILAKFQSSRLDTLSLYLSLIMV